MPNKAIIITAIILLLLVVKPQKSQAEPLIKQFEGLRLDAYKDSGGVWTIGWGSIYNLDLNRPVQAGDRIDDATALRWLRTEISEKYNYVKKAIKVPVNQNQLDSLTSFAYNVGVGAFKSSTLLKKLNEGKPEIEVADEFPKWNKIKGVISAGLTRRRKLERDLFLK
jgi:lysozyme